MKDEFRSGYRLMGFFNLVSSYHTFRGRTITTWRKGDAVDIVQTVKGQEEKNGIQPLNETTKWSRLDKNSICISSHTTDGWKETLYTRLMEADEFEETLSATVIEFKRVQS